MKSRVYIALNTQVLVWFGNRNVLSWRRKQLTVIDHVFCLWASCSQFYVLFFFAHHSLALATLKAVNRCVCLLPSECTSKEKSKNATKNETQRNATLVAFFWFFFSLHSDGNKQTHRWTALLDWASDWLIDWLITWCNALHCLWYNSLLCFAPSNRVA